MSRPWAVLLIVTLGLLAGWGSTFSDLFAGSPEPFATPVITAPNDPELMAFARAVQDVVDAGDVEGLAALVDWNLFMARAVAGLVRKPLRAQAELVDAAKSRGILANLIKVGAKRGGVRFLEAKSLATHGERRAVFRLLPEDGGFDHCAFVLHRGSDGSVRAVDWNLLSIGEDGSALAGRVLRAQQDVAAMAGSASSEEQMLLRHAKRLSEMQKLIAAGKPKEALLVYATLPPAVKHLKLMLQTRVAAAQQLDQDTWRAALEDLVAHHPDDRSTVLSAIDLHLMRGDHAKALAVIDELAVKVGPDPNLHVIRGDLLLAMDRFEAARAATELALAEEPELLPAYWTLVSIALASKDMALVGRTLGELVARGEVDLEQLRSAPEYKEFVATEHYSKLVASVSAAEDVPAQ